MKLFSERVRAHVMLICCVLMVSLSNFELYSVATIADVLERELDTTTSGVGLMSSVSFFAAVCSLIPFGILYEELSNDFLMAVSALCCALSSIIFAMSKSLGVAIFSRFILGVFAAPIYAGSVSIVSSRFGSENMPSVWGIGAAVLNVVIMAAIYSQAVIYSKYNRWRVVFYFLFAAFLLLTAVIGGIVIYEGMFLEDASDSKKRVNDDANGAAVKTPTSELVECEAGIEMSAKPATDSSPTDERTKVDTKPATDKRILSLSISRKEIDKPASERAKERSQMDQWNRIKDNFKAMASNPQNWWLNLISFGVYMLNCVWTGLWLPMFLMAKFEYSRSTAALLTSMTFLGMAIGSAALGHISKVYQRRTSVLFVAALFFCCTEAVIFCPKNSHVLLVGTLLFVSGLGSDPYVVLFASIREHNYYDDCLEFASSVAVLTAMIGGFLSQAIGGVLLDWHWKSRKNRKKEYDSKEDKEFRVYVQSDYWAAFYLVHAALICQLVAVAFVKETYGKPVQKAS